MRKEFGNEIWLVIWLLVGWPVGLDGFWVLSLLIGSWDVVVVFYAVMN